MNIIFKNIFEKSNKNNIKTIMECAVRAVLFANRTQLCDLNRKDKIGFYWTGHIVTISTAKKKYDYFLYRNKKSIVCGFMGETK